MFLLDSVCALICLLLTVFVSDRCIVSVVLNLQNESPRIFRADRRWYGTRATVIIWRIGVHFICLFKREIVDNSTGKERLL